MLCFDNGYRNNFKTTNYAANRGGIEHVTKTRKGWTKSTQRVRG